MNIWLLSVALQLVCFSGIAQEKRLSDHVVLISIDGFRPEFYLEEKWPAPNLKQMVLEGTHAVGVRGVFPSVTYPSHTTIITGQMPGAHGIYYNVPFDPTKQTKDWYWYADSIKMQTLWHAVKEAGLKSASFIWPVSVGAPIDYNIPEFWDAAEGHGNTGPMRSMESPAGLLAEMEKAVLGELNESTFNGDYLNREDRTGEMAAYVLEKYKPDFTTVHLIATDHFQHSEGREGPMVFKSLAAIDRAIGKIMEAAERAGIADRTTFIIVGDHGFVDIHTSLSPNIWLKDAGLLEDKEDRGDWKAVFHTSGASAFLHLKEVNDEKTVAAVRKLIEDQPSDVKQLFRIVEREALDKIGADPNAVLALAPIEGISMSGALAGELLKPAKGGTHGFFPDFTNIETGFVAWGAGIAEGKEIKKMGLEDVAGIVTKLLNLKMDIPATKLSEVFVR
ncbi:alkaline phosphatase family protein [Anditalea andensis]|uniref:AP endonuclease n=1 Tax=Anditalea andensis TaxID=1048983 RepID=A0A074LD48_9BACT|nr:ectonucleotide pyrophosphatase/phosphodiesterase [Anditalea andensis]KEO71697.1 AP endonuclease [Anditalea andensis]